MRRPTVDGCAVNIRALNLLFEHGCARANDEHDSLEKRKGKEEGSILSILNAVRDFGDETAQANIPGISGGEKYRS